MMFGKRRPHSLPVFGWIRYIHFVAAYLFLANFVFRIYWGFVGNKYANWKNFIPTSRKFFQEMWEVLRIDIFLQTKPGEHMSVGHNALGRLYLFPDVYRLFGIQVHHRLWPVCRHERPGGLPGCLPGWFRYLFGADSGVRNLHHILMWFFIFFTIVHIYFVFYHDYVKGRGEISSMGGGWKFIEEEAFQAEKAKEAAESKKAA
jgi:Ni/Fe-hydrogenase 1 B-type cytochrome subunit